MPFEDLETITTRNQPPQATISYCVARRNGKAKADKKPRLMISIPTTLCGTSKAAPAELKPTIMAVAKLEHGIADRRKQLNTSHRPEGS